MVFHWSLSDRKSPQVSRTLLSILAVLNNAVIWMVSTRPPTSKSSSPFINPLVTVLNVPITIGIIITCMFHSFFNSLARSRYLSFFSHSFSFILCSAGTAKSTILQILFFVVDYYYYYYCYKFHYYHFYFTPCKFLTPASPGGAFNWIWVTASFQDFSKCSGRPQQCCHLNGLFSSSFFPKPFWTVTSAPTTIVITLPWVSSIPIKEVVS